jgi:hypothetical protein
MQPREPPGQQCQFIFFKHVELLIWQRHQGRKRVHLGGWVSVRLST